MRLPLIKICAAVAVSLVADGAHAESSNVTTKSARAPPLGQGIKRLRTHKSTTQVDEEERSNIAKQFGLLVEKFKTEPANVLTRAKPLLDVVRSALESGYFTDLFEQFYKSRVLSDDVHREMEVYDQDVKLAFRNAYIKFVNDKNSNIQPTLAEPLSTRRKDKGPAEVVEVVEVQSFAKMMRDHNRQDAVWLDNRTPPTDVLKLLKLDEARDDRLEQSDMFRWIKYADKYDKKYHTPKATTLLVYLKYPEETLVNMVFSWDLRRNNFKKGVKESLKSLPINRRQQMEKTLLSRQEMARKKIMEELMRSWLDIGYAPDKVLTRLGLLPTLQTGFDFSRLVEWVDYARLWAANNKSKIQMRMMMRTIEQEYKGEQLDRLLEKADENSIVLDKALANWIANYKKERAKNAASTSLNAQEGSTKKRKRGT